MSHLITVGVGSGDPQDLVGVGTWNTWTEDFTVDPSAMQLMHDEYDWWGLALGISTP